MQVPEPTRRTLYALSLVVLAATLAGCGTLAGDDHSLPDGAEVGDRLEGLETIEATIVTGFSNGTTATDSRIHTLQNIRTGESRAVMQSGPQEGMTIGSNGSAMWIYNRSADRVEVLQTNLSRSNRTQSFETVETIFDRLHEAERGEPTEVRISQLPVVPRPGGPVTTAPGSVSTYGNVTITYDGTETVDGREAYVVALEPTDDGQLIDNTTMWFDTEWYYPLRTNTTIALDDESQRSTVTYRNVTFNPEIPDGTFAFDPPENATVVTQSMPETHTYDSRSGLEEATNASVPEPDVPDGFTFVEGRRSIYEGNATIALEYTNGTANVSVTSAPRTATSSDTGEKVDIAGEEGRLLTIGETDYVTWNCGDQQYTVTGSVGEETVLSIARSIGCR